MCGHSCDFDCSREGKRDYARQEPSKRLMDWGRPLFGISKLTNGDRIFYQTSTREHWYLCLVQRLDWSIFLHSLSWDNLWYFLFILSKMNNQLKMTHWERDLTNSTSQCELTKFCKKENKTDPKPIPKGESKWPNQK